MNPKDYGTLDPETNQATGTQERGLTTSGDNVFIEVQDFTRHKPTLNVVRSYFNAIEAEDKSRGGFYFYGQYLGYGTLRVPDIENGGLKDLPVVDFVGGWCAEGENPKNVQVRMSGQHQVYSELTRLPIGILFRLKWTGKKPTSNQKSMHLFSIEPLI